MIDIVEVQVAENGGTLASFFPGGVTQLTLHLKYEWLVCGCRPAETGPRGHQSKNAALSGDAESLHLPRALFEDGQAHGQLSHGVKRTAHLQHPGHGQVLRDQQTHPEPSAQPGGGGFDRSGWVQWRRDQEPLCLLEIQSVQYQAVGERRRVPLRDAGTEP